MMFKYAVQCLVGCLAVCPLLAQQVGTAAGPAPAPLAEDWARLRVNPASLEPLSYAVIGTAETPDFTRQLLRVQWRTGDPIDLYVIKPYGVAKPQVILYLYGFPSNNDRFRDDAWCKRATQGGFAAVGFVSALTGDRYANRPMKEWFVSELRESLGTSVHDVQMVLNYLATREDLVVNEVGMFGQGSGGSIAILAATADSRITVLDVLDPWGDWPDWFKTSPEVPEDERATYLRPEFLERLTVLDPSLYLSHLKLKRLRVEQVMDEPVTPLDAKEKIGAAIPRSEDLVRYKNERAHLESWRVTGLTGWIRDQMRPSPSSLSENHSAVARPSSTLLVTDGK